MSPVSSVLDKLAGQIVHTHSSSDTCQDHQRKHLHDSVYQEAGIAGCISVHTPICKLLNDRFEWEHLTLSVHTQAGASAYNTVSRLTLITRTCTGSYSGLYIPDTREDTCLINK